MAKTVFDVLLQSIADEYSSVADSIISGAVKDHSEYRELCGLIRGLEIARREIQDLARNYLDDNDD